MTTLRDLSRHLNLSVTQVSRALNGYSDVNEETRERVLKVAKDLNYHPNLTARRLVTGRSGVVGLVLPDVPKAPADSLFVQIVGGLSRHFSRKGMQFVLHIADPSENIVEVYRRLIDSGSLDGFVILEPRIGDPRIDFLTARKVPFVIHGRIAEPAGHAYFDIDNAFVGRRLTELVLAAGHRRIAFVNGPAGAGYVEERRGAWVRAQAEAGLRADPALHFCAEMTEGFGLRATYEAMTHRGPRPTAVVCGNTLIAKGVLSMLSALGLRVPQDVSVVAHDDELPGVSPAAFDPPLTVTRAPLALSWEPLADILAGAIAGQPLAELQQLGEVEVIERGSIAAPDAAEIPARTA